MVRAPRRGRRGDQDTAGVLDRNHPLSKIVELSSDLFSPTTGRVRKFGGSRDMVSEACSLNASR